MTKDEVREKIKNIDKLTEDEIIDLGLNIYGFILEEWYKEKTKGLKLEPINWEEIFNEYKENGKNSTI